jgi:hypothetical protein
MGGDDAGGMGGEGGGPELADPCRGLEIPSDQHYTAPGLCVRAVATAQGRLRQIAFTSNGDLIGVTVPGAIVRYRDENENGSYSGSGEIVTLGMTGSMKRVSQRESDPGKSYRSPLKARKQPESTTGCAQNSCRMLSTLE